MTKEESILRGLKVFLAYFNLAFLCIGIGVASFSPLNGWELRTEGQPNPITVWVASHHTEGLPWFMLASLSFSLGIYKFTHDCLFHRRNASSAERQDTVEISNA